MLSQICYFNLFQVLVKILLADTGFVSENADCSIIDIQHLPELEGVCFAMAKGDVILYNTTTEQVYKLSALHTYTYIYIYIYIYIYRKLCYSVILLHNNSCYVGLGFLFSPPISYIIMSRDTFSCFLFLLTHPFSHSPTSPSYSIFLPIYLHTNLPTLFTNINTNTNKLYLMKGNTITKKYLYSSLRPCIPLHTYFFSL